MTRRRSRRAGPKSSKTADDANSESAKELEENDKSDNRESVSSPQKDLVEDEESEVQQESAQVEVEPEVLKDSVEPEKVSNDESSEDVNEKSAVPTTSDVDNTENEAVESEPVKPVLRLVPLTKLLKPDLLDEDKPSKTPRKTKKNTSYIEISSESSEEDEQISIDSSSSESNKRSRRKRDAGSSKENSTNNKLSNGAGKKKKAKDVVVQLEKMPNNVNKLMKCYRVENSRESMSRIESWSDTDDFENMISTSKIDRVAVTKPPPVEKEPSPPAVEKSSKTKRGRKNKKTSDESEDNEPVLIKKSVEESSRPKRNSAKTAMERTKKVIAKASLDSSEEEPEEEEILTAKKKTRQTAVTDVSSKKKSQETEASSSDEKLSKKKKKSSKDDHGKEKKNPARREEKSSSSEEEVLSKIKSKETKQSSPTRSTRSKKEVVHEKETRSTKGKKASDLKITINLNKKEVVKEDSDEKRKKESSLSDDERLNPIKLGVTKKPATKSTSESEVESSASDGVIAPAGSESDLEIPDEEKSPILDQKLRKRNKFESNDAFKTLKQIIEQKKGKKKENEPEKKPAQRKQNHNGNDEKNNNDEDDDESIAKAKSLAAKRKRLLSSSEEETEKNDKEKNGDTKTPAKKKKKMSSGEESDYEATSGDEKKVEESENEKNSSDEDDDDQPKKRKAKASSSEDDDDDDEDEQPRKRKARNDSDASDFDEDIDELEKDRPKNKRRKRIKKVASSDEEGGENGDKSKTGRKNIRKMMKTDKLDVSTKEAAKIERERKQRIEERQKMYNQFYDERPEEAKEITQLVLDFNEETKKPLLQVDKKLVKKLKPHQANGVKFMWDACFESLDRCEKDHGSGCILAHCMGLGKTLQVITLVHTLLKNTDETGVSRVLVVCPLSTVLNWVNEFNIWLKDIPGREDIYVYEINKLKQNVDRANKLMEWHNDGGIMILSYDMFRNLSSDTGGRLRKKVKESLQTSLVDPGPDLVICDEGHLLKNEKTSISKAMMRLRTLRRVVLTGTPLQNNLKEYYCMVQFVKPNLLGKYQEYMNRFVNPITNGQYTDSTEYDIQVMRRRAHVLHKMLDGCVQRRDYSVLAPFLPPKHEYVMSIKLTPMQVKLYKYYMENRSRANEENGGRKGSILFQDFQNLQRIWTAPLVLRYNSNRYELEMQKRRDLESEDESEGSLKDFIDDSESAVSTSSASSDNDSDEDGASINSDEKKKSKKKKKQKHAPLPRRTRAMAAEIPSDPEAEEIVAAQKKENPTEWWMQICPEEELNNINHSSKLMLLMSILEECEAIGDKLLVFSQSLYSLDVIEHFLNYIDEQTQKNAACASFTGSWTLGQDYFRLDGSTPVEQRNASCKHFNSPSNPRARLFLISTRAGGLGINLVAANRVIIFDVSWNPSHDIQSIFRVYRFGQTKPCYIYRFLALGTMEEKIYERQVTKQAISKRVIDEQQIDRHYNQNDLQELYRYDLEPDDERILPILPKDRLFAEMLKKFEDVIYKYHEHDTLLENKEEETLNEEERKQAWEEFEAEKSRPQFVANYVPQQQPRGIGPVTSNNIFGIRTDVLLKLLSMKARLDQPRMTDTEVKSVIPMLMQELYRQMERGELTLYQQLVALSSSLEVPPNYGGQFRVNENLMQQTYNSYNAMPSTSAGAFRQQQIADRQQQLLRLAQQHQRQQMLSDQLKQRSPPRIVGSVIEID